MGSALGIQQPYHVGLQSYVFVGRFEIGVEFGLGYRRKSTRIARAEVMTRSCRGEGVLILNI